MKKIKILVLLLVVSITIVACKSTSKLSVPEKLRIENDILFWNGDDHASSYKIKIEDNEYQSIITQHELNLGEGVYSIKVRAVGDGLNYESSDWSIEIEYTRNNEIIDDIHYRNVPDEKKSVVLSGGLGRGINTINKSYIDYSQLALNDLIDENKLEEINLREYYLGHSALKTITEEDAESFASSFSIEYMNSKKSNASLPINGLAFSANLNTHFNISNTFKLKHDAKTYFYLSTQRYGGNVITLQNFVSDIDDYKESLSDSVYKRLDEMLLLDGSVLDNKIAYFFDLFGTHIIVSGIYGGKIDTYYSLISNDREIINETNVNFGSEINAGIKAGELGIGVSSAQSIDSKLHIGTKNAKTQTNFSMSAHGGNMFSSPSFSNLGETYKNWIKDFNSKIDDYKYRTLVDINQNGLVPVWDLFPERYETLKNKISTYFNQKIKDTENEFLSKFIKEEPSTEYEMGSKEKPYEINEYTQLNEILDDPERNKENVHFKLTNDIDFSNERWPSKQYTFYGVLDGDGKTLRNLNVESSQYPDYGFITYNRGIIKNLVIEDFTISNNNNPENTPTEVSNKRVGFIGINYGTIENSLIRNANIELKTKYNDDKPNKSINHALIGGFAGENQGTIRKSTAINVSIEGSIDAVRSNEWNDGLFVIGGIAGYSTTKNANIEDCLALEISMNTAFKLSGNNKVSGSRRGGNAKIRNGGIVGEITGGARITRCFATDISVSQSVDKSAGNGTNHTTTDFKNGLVIGNMVQDAEITYIFGGTGDGWVVGSTDKYNDKRYEAVSDFINSEIFLNVFKKKGWIIRENYPVISVVS